jgi:hypothetical protein
MPIYLAPDDDYSYVAPRSSLYRAREIATLLNRHGIPHDAPTLVALLRLTWRIAVSVVL